MDFYGFYTGKIFDAYKYLGAHVRGDGTVFRTFAPAASRVGLIGEFSGWEELPMTKVHDGNFWEISAEKAKPGMMYKYRIWSGDGSFTDHCDPYGYGAELRPGTASVIRDMENYRFHDAAWMKKRSDCRNRPLNIYEIHFGSFRKPSPEPDAWYSYDELAGYLIPYLKECGYNYLEIMPLCEYPSDESWGYQGTGFFSPTSRYGTADQLKQFVDVCHQNEIGVILDFVPVHFAVDGYALAHYDGTALYEYPHAAVGQSEWGSCNFMHSRGEVRSFLQSSADYWLSEYHLDGLRMDAISRAIYWQGAPERGVNSNAVEFIRHMNRGLKERHPDAILAAEDSTAFPGVTKAPEQGGLGFDYKWDMGWMNDTLDYFRTDPLYRGGDYHKLTFSMAYYNEERYLLPFSHDEVVHGKATILQKMFGDYDMKFPQARALYMYMYAHPGKKLNFMGNELGHFREWDEKRELDWNLLEYPAHRDFHRFMRDLNHFYLEHPAFFEGDYDPDGFRWIECGASGNSTDRCVYAFRRGCGSAGVGETSGSGTVTAVKAGGDSSRGDRSAGNRTGAEREQIVAVFNFSGVSQDYFPLAIAGAQRLRRLFSSESPAYGGTAASGRDALPGELLRQGDGTFRITLPPFSAGYYLAE